jgi:hypothetical protein
MANQATEAAATEPQSRVRGSLASRSPTVCDNKIDYRCYLIAAAANIAVAGAAGCQCASGIIIIIIILIIIIIIIIVVVVVVVVVVVALRLRRLYSQEVGAVQLRPVVLHGPGLPFGICLGEEAAEGGDGSGDLLNLGPPPRDDSGLERVGRAATK